MVFIGKLQPCIRFMLTRGTILKSHVGGLLDHGNLRTWTEKGANCLKKIRRNAVKHIKVAVSSLITVITF